jgi:hypothetical protein
MTDKEVKDTISYLKRHIADEFANMIEIIQLYYKIDSITDFKLDLQLYPASKYSGQTEPRIWLSAPDNHLGVNLMLYSVKLCDTDCIVPNEMAFEIYSEYMKYYSENQELFKLWHNENDNYKPTASITFEISNRSR